MSLSPRRTPGTSVAPALCWAKLWMVRPLGFRIEDRRVRRSGMDYWQHLVWETVDDWNALATRLPKIDRKPWFFSKTGEQLFHTARFQRGDVFVFGSESRDSREPFSVAIRNGVCGSPFARTPVA